MGSPLPGYQKRTRRVSREGFIRPRGVCVLGVCGSLREVHLLLRGVLQTRHQVTVARYEIRDPFDNLSVSLVLFDSQILVHADSCQSDPMAPSSLLIALATTYFNTRPPAVISRRPLPSSSFYLFYSIPPSLPTTRINSLKRRN
jgi:hypothetical protein